MRRTIIQCLVSVITFIISVVIASVFINTGNTDMTAKMEEASLPLMHISTNAMMINELHGYTEEMNAAVMRESITPIDTSRRIQVVFDIFDNDIKSLSYEIRTKDNQRLIENTEIRDYNRKKNTIEAVLVIKDLIEEHEEYNLTFVVEDDFGRTVRYYTKLIMADDYHVREKLDFIRDFHQRLYDRERAKELAMYLEPNSMGDNTTFAKVDIHSNFNQITWGELKVKEINEPVYEIKDISAGLINVRIKYMVSIEKEGRDKNFDANEYIRIRYTRDRVYLLNYEREICELIDIDDNNFANNKILLGITNEDVMLTESDGGNVIAFISGGRLFSYNIADNKFAQLFSFYDRDNYDARTLYDAHRIKIMSVDEIGNVHFVVYGYMNRGRHEGMSGVQCCYYNSQLNTVEERAFVPDNRSWEILSNDMGRLCYMDTEDNIYLLMAGSIYRIGAENNRAELIISDLEDGGYKISDNSKIVAWRPDDDRDGNRVNLTNLSGKKTAEVRTYGNNIICPLGFMGEDFVYGIADKDNIRADSSGTITVPMHELRIENFNGELLKKYSPEEAFVTDIEIVENMINLARAKYDEKTDSYVPVEDDQILYNREESIEDNFVSVAVTEKYESLLQLTVKKEIEYKKLKVLTPREVIFEGKRDVYIEPSKDNMEPYYVYGKYALEDICSDSDDAVKLAVTKSGCVVCGDGRYIWKNGDRRTRNQIMKIEAEKCKEGETPLSVCLDTILRYENNMKDSSFLLGQGMSVIQILENNIHNAKILNLKGVSLDTVLYYVDRDIPVLVSLSDDDAMLITGYNELNIVLMDPVKGEIYKRGLNDSKAWLEENGNSFITYVRGK